jgi:hypothetical protein
MNNSKMNFNNFSIFDIIEKSSECTLISVLWNCHGFILRCLLPDFNEHFNLDDNQIISIEVKTNIVYYNFPDNLNNILSCYFCLVDLQKNVDVNTWGYYSPAIEKREYMQQLKKDYFMAFGIHSQKYKWLFQITGCKKYFSALIHSINDLKFHLE